uniref:Uncharacterized protein n=1 Tax=Cyclopterus lumpus TaxID=8103 RepID=A0A8C3G3M3_CYCLU
MFYGYYTNTSHGNLAVQVFCCWDFKVTKKLSVKLQSEKISTQLKELLSEVIGGEDEKSCTQRLCRLVVHLMAWATCLASICLGAMAVHYLSEQSPFREAELLLLSAVVSGVNLLLPGLFNLCAWMESHDSPSVRVYVSIFSRDLITPNVIFTCCPQCWESFFLWRQVGSLPLNPFF